MPTKTRTKKPDAKPQRKPRKATQKAPTAEEIGRSIGDALGRRLSDLLSKPEPELIRNPGFDAVSAWTVEKLGDRVTSYKASYTEQDAPAKGQSALHNAIDRLRCAINGAETTTDSTHVRLQDVLSPPLPTAGGSNPSPPPSNDSPLVCAINEFADRVFADNRRRNELLDRLEL